MKTHMVTRVSITAEKLLKDKIIAILEEEGATGYSFFDGGGKGAHGEHPAHRPSIVDEFSLVKIEVIIASRKDAETIAERIANDYFKTYSGIVYLDEVEILRPEKF